MPLSLIVTLCMNFNAYRLLTIYCILIQYNIYKNTITVHFFFRNQGDNILSYTI